MVEIGIGDALDVVEKILHCRPCRVKVRVVIGMARKVRDCCSITMRKGWGHLP